MVTGIDNRLKDLHFLPGELRTFQPPDEFLCFSGEHGAADHFDPSELFLMINSVFEKHFVILNEINGFNRYLIVRQHKSIKKERPLGWR